MNLATFLLEIGEIREIPSAMMDHLRRLAPNLSDEELGDTFQKVQKIDADFLKNKRSMVHLVEEADRMVGEFEHHVVKPMHKLAAEADSQSDGEYAETLLI